MTCYDLTGITMILYDFLYLSCHKTISNHNDKKRAGTMSSSPFQIFKLCQEYDLFPCDDQTAEVRGVHALLISGNTVVVFVADTKTDAPETVLGQRDVQGAFVIDAVVFLEMVENRLIGHVRDEFGINLAQLLDLQFVMVTELDADVVAVVQLIIVRLVNVGETSAETDFEVIRVQNVESVTSGGGGVKLVVVELILFGLYAGVPRMGSAVDAAFKVSASDDFLFVLHTVLFGIMTANIEFELVIRACQCGFSGAADSGLFRVASLAGDVERDFILPFAGFRNRNGGIGLAGAPHIFDIGIGDNCAVDGGFAVFRSADFASDRGSGGGRGDNHRFVRCEIRDVVEVDLHFAERVGFDGELTIDDLDDFAFDSGTVLQIDLVSAG